MGEALALCSIAEELHECNADKERKSTIFFTSGERIMLDKDNDPSGGVAQFQPFASCAEQEFKAIGMDSFFDTSEDDNVDWEDLFDVS